jgi:type II secretory pathway component PulF
LSAGVTVTEALDAITEQTRKKQFKKALASVVENVREGFSLSEAFRANPQVFPPVFFHTLAAAEEAGAVEQALETLAGHFLREAQFKERMRQALVYPMLVVGLTAAEVIGLFTFVVPKFARLLKGAGAPLPAVTRMLLHFSENIGSYLAAGALFAALAALVLSFLFKRERARALFEGFFIRIPVLGRLVSRAAAARVCRSMALMLKVGVPTVRVLELAAQVALFFSFRKEILAAQAAVREGRPLAGSFAGARWLPRTSVQMIAVGERSGRLDEMLERSADLFETEVDLLMQKIPPVTEAALVVTAGGIVIFVLMSIFLPILAIYRTVH